MVFVKQLYTTTELEKYRVYCEEMERKQLSPVSILEYITVQKNLLEYEK